MTMARPTYSAIAAATCPEGKLDVGGAASSLGTAGRGRSTMKVVVTNTQTSRSTAKKMSPTCRHRRAIASSTMTAVPTPITVPVAPRSEPALVHAFSAVVLRDMNHSSTFASQRRPLRAGARA